MGKRRKTTVDIRELLHRIQKRESDRAIARQLKMNRKTVAQYRRWAEKHGLLEKELPSVGELSELLEETFANSKPPQNCSSVEPFRQVVERLRGQKVEVAAIYQRLRERGYQGSLSSVYRFVRSLEPHEPDAMVRVETTPGEEAQVDFGYAGMMFDPELDKWRKSWVFVMTLCWSRHQYVEFVHDQKIETWLNLHRHAFEYFEGVPKRIVPDNLKAAIVHACWHEPLAQESYRECALHYDFLIAPCRPRTPRHKGKVEQGGVHYVKRNFLGGREPTTLQKANEDVLAWCNTTAGRRKHGTTKEVPLERFQVEKKCLGPLPRSRYDVAVWKELKVGRDCYVHFDSAYYSVPFRLVGQSVWVRGCIDKVEVYTADHQLITTHCRARKAGERVTNVDHLPPHKVPGLTVTRAGCLEEAKAIGTCTHKVVASYLEHRPEDRLRTAARLLRFGKQVGAERLEAACSRAIRFGDTSYKTIKLILKKGLEAEPAPVRKAAPPAETFVRTANELFGALVGGVSWK
ncbi:Transposase [Desulfacinum hydrothermale DSM 13146]|uniref:Transposase n=1 Tax=Desulfacinum hydrothermale DSM 13146 TaxID=1121390 RepID=A0A1W1XX43_9BACT|nr:IS21 family transposase [Desulfacinum hydrothermale]SMC28414.1 Transposase [Desulfacinum hydrothermale DSM 13146]